MTFKEWFRKRVGLGNQNERDMLADWAAEREKLIGALEKLEQAEPCPNCVAQGWFVQADRNTGEAEQIQCEWCETIENSVFNRKREARAVLAEVKG